MSTTARVFVSVALALGSVMGAGCGDDSPTANTSDRIVNVELTPSSLTLTSLRETHQVTAIARDANGDPVAGVRFSWSSADKGVAIVDADGLVTAIGPGSVTVSARAEDISGSASVSVDQRPALLAFVAAPADTWSGTRVAPAVEVAIRDALGHTVAGATNSVTVTIEPDDGGTTLSGITTVAAVNGVATFDDLMLSGTNSVYRLVATAADVTADTSAQFNILNLSAGLIAHWSFDEGSGTNVGDASQFQVDGTIYGANWTAGAASGGLSFDGVDDYIQVPDNTSSPPPHLTSPGKGSISVWFKVDKIPIDNGIAPIFYYGASGACANSPDAANQGLIVEVGHSPLHPQSRRLYFTIFAGGCQAPTVCFDSWNDPISEGEWHHFVAVVGEGYNTGYLNGKEMVNRNYNFGDDTFSKFFADAVSHEALWIGRGYWDASASYFDGTIDDVRIYDRPLVASEVQRLYDNSP